MSKMNSPATVEKSPSLPAADTVPSFLPWSSQLETQKDESVALKGGQVAQRATTTREEDRSEELAASPATDRLEGFENTPSEKCAEYEFRDSEVDDEEEEDDDEVEDDEGDDGEEGDEDVCFCLNCAFTELLYEEEEEHHEGVCFCDTCALIEELHEEEMQG
ncbi:uncharacterized protein BP5553_09750 [Venustampulla echinocandica]|uniref:Uncharacterized protein n=1 Tax=Venustampulla echinocandica TaxID=2656787 RepID=A0A370TBW0_9HELO|nr:uncharacterized protein BP5553_09750 [Venustampulla echinocandica]RDL31541.1 hypothetical protein BP5553_09750 [Venustampulla echinocandica]